MIPSMPGESYRGPLPSLTPQEVQLQMALERDVKILAQEIGERNYLNPANLKASADFLETEFLGCGYQVQRQAYQVNDQTFENLAVEIKGSDHPDEIIVIGGHYDSVGGCPGANDNGSGAAAVLELARLFAPKKPARTLRFVEFVNEEPPFAMTENMGSLVYARYCKQSQDNIVGMLSLETMGYYSEELGSQRFPFPLGNFYPSTGNYIAFVTHLKSAALVRQIVGSFRRHTQFPSEGAAVPGLVTGISYSDHWSFWEQGYPAVMVTDTAMFRYPYYHAWNDTPEQVNYEYLARVVAGLERVVEELVS
ncbi:M28 family peptidase [Lyngbya aestuarii]|uniref:M28 family peptidase n=1 Tax=Lyngbya aestuarii TaxID=118322 RepID=UPI00042A7353|nr:M28 family peptidase [Lyngbya aestuarii]